MSRKGSGTFGLVSSGRSRGKFRGGSRGGSRGRGRTNGRGGNAGATGSARTDGTAPNVPKKDEDGTQLAERFERVALNDEVDEKLGFVRVQEGPKKEGWLVNMHPVRVLHSWCGFLWCSDAFLCVYLYLDADERPGSSFWEGCC